MLLTSLSSRCVFWYMPRLMHPAEGFRLDAFHSPYQTCPAQRCCHYG
nr:MAG TPA: hypothetical protein [Caudoviricetes sp.]